MMHQAFLLYNHMLIKSTMLIMTLLFLPVFLSIIFQFATMKRLFKTIDAKIIFALVAIFCLGFWLRNSEYRYGMNLDGTYYQAMAKSIHARGELTQGCALGSSDNCLYKYNAVVLPGYPYLIAVLFKFFGAKDLLAMHISGILGSLNIVLVFLLYLLLFHKPSGALISACTFACLPLDIWISQTSAVRTTGIFFACLSCVFFLLAIREKKISLWISSVLCLSYAAYVRLDFYLLIVPFIVHLCLNKDKLTKSDAKNIVLSLMVFIVHQCPAFAWLINNHFGLTGGNEATFLFNRVVHSGPVLFSFFFEKKFGHYFFNPFFSVFFILGLVWSMISKKRGNGIFALLLFCAFFLGIASFYHGVAGKETIRYLQPIGIPYSLLAGLAIDKFFSKSKIKIAPFVLFVVLLLASIIPYFKFRLFADGRMNEATIFEHRKYYDALPKNVLLFSRKPQLYDLDLMPNNKELVVASFGQNQFDEYLGFKSAFKNMLFKYKDLRWFVILQENDKCADFRKMIDNVEMDIVDIQGLNADSELYEIKDKNKLLSNLEKMSKFSSGLL